MAEENTQAQGQPRETARKRARWSDVYQHFTCFTDAHGNNKARCNNCGLELGANTKNGTISLRAHVSVCKAQGVVVGAAGGGESHPASLPPSPPPPRQLLPSGPGESSDREPAGLEEEASRDLARMVALHGYDPSVLEDDYFRRFVRRLNPEFEVPTRHAIEEMCDGIFDETRRDLFSNLRRISGRFSLQVGKATTTEAGQFLYTACHFIDDEWNLHKMVMSAYVDVPFVGYHGSILLVPEIVLDNPASIEEEFESAIMDHLSSEDIFDRLFMVARKTRPDEIHHLKAFFSGSYAVNRGLICTTYIDNGLGLIAEDFSLQNDEFVEVPYSHLENIDMTRRKRQQHLSHFGLDYPWAYGGHWYSCYCSLRVLNKEDDSILADEHLLTELLCRVWGQIYRAIQAISATSCPTSNLVLVELFNVRDILQSELARVSGEHADLYSGYNDFSGSKNIAEVLRKARDSVDKVIQNSYLVWCIPLVLDPRYKLAYIQFILQRAFGSDAADYISEVTRKMEEMYTDYYDDDDDDDEMVDGSADSLQQAWDKHRRTQTKPELDRYLNDPLVETPQGFDILKWWKDNSRNFPKVALMARDALAMPTCSKLSSEQMAQVKSIVRGYSKEPCGSKPSSASASGGGGDAMIP